MGTITGKAVVAGAMVAGAALALAMGTQASAQTYGASYGQPGYGQPGADQPMAPADGGRWGSQVDGRWWGGANAPGGWSAYRTPYHGYRLPAYWTGPRFQVDDWTSYGLPAPPVGYHWSRYYDDAVLADGRGSVYDWRSGVNWTGYDAGYGQPGYGPRPRRAEGNGYAGAAVGAVAGGVAGNLIAGRGNRLGGTLIGAGVGGAAGYAIGHTQDGYRALPPGYGAAGAGYPVPGDGPEHHRERRYEGGPGYPPPPAEWRSADGATTVTVTTGAGGAPVIALPPAAYGYGYGYAAGGTVTTVTVQTAPVVTTTTTEVVEDRTYVRRPVVRHYYAPRRVWHPRRCPPAVIGS